MHPEPSFHNIVIAVGTIMLTLTTVGLIIARLYQRASKETAYVRTGFGGQKVILNGGSLVFPVLHEIIPVNMNTLRLEVRRANDQALITKDRMRVDVQAEFYVRAQPTEESIAAAAQTLGRRTMDPKALKELVEGKFVDALRSVAAELAMEELHEQRVQFVNKVQIAVSEDLLKNGLELESVSLTGLDQTRLEYFSPQNAFDAEGLTRLTEQIETRRKKRNDIEQDTRVQIELKNLEAERKQSEIRREMEFARLGQEREVEIRKAQQSAEISRERTQKEQEVQQASIAAKRQLELDGIESERAVDELRVEKLQRVKERDLARERAISTTEIARRRAVDLAEQERAIAFAEKSRLQSEAQTEADRARALAVQAEQQIITVREREVAERAKAIDLITAAQAAERQAVAITIAAEAEKHAAEDRAAATRTAAHADADRVRIAAQGAAEAERMAADAAARRYEVEALGKRAAHEATNVLSHEQLALQVKLAVVQTLPSMIRESARPMERIEGIKIVQVDGLNPHAVRTDGSTGAPELPEAPRNLAEDVMRTALRYRAQAPLVDALLAEIGLKQGLSGSFSGLLSDVTKHVTNGHAGSTPLPGANAVVHTPAAAVPNNEH
ncbi:MAG: yqiK [Myxococcaceae bacterium]|nr:yqiK [Myxococcaceae bacterium]